MEKDYMHDDEIASTTISMKSLCSGKGVDKWFHLSHDEEKAGEIHLKSVWTPKPAPKPKANDGEDTNKMTVK
jgi:hypothetical protein